MLTGQVVTVSIGDSGRLEAIHAEISCQGVQRWIRLVSAQGGTARHEEELISVHLTCVASTIIAILCPASVFRRWNKPRQRHSRLLRTKARFRRGRRVSRRQRLRPDPRYVQSKEP